MDSQSHDPNVDAQLDALESKLDRLLKEYPNDADFWNAFAGETEAILKAATAQYADYAQGRIDCMLKNTGMIPGEDEGEPCK